MHLGRPASEASTLVVQFGHPLLPMKSFARLLGLGIMTCLCLQAASVASAAAGEDGFKPLFNGKDLTQWEGLPQFWSVKEGAITGQTTKDNPAKGNTFIVWKGGEVSDFELRLS